MSHKQFFLFSFYFQRFAGFIRKKCINSDSPPRTMCVVHYRSERSAFHAATTINLHLAYVPGRHRRAKPGFCCQRSILLPQQIATASFCHSKRYSCAGSTSVPAALPPGSQQQRPSTCCRPAIFSGRLLPASHFFRPTTAGQSFLQDCCRSVITL